MEISSRLPANHSLPKRDAATEPAAEPAEPRDYLVLVYSANNVYSLGPNPQPVAGSYKLLPELKALASRTAGANVSIVTQGYEKLETGRWVTRRYRIEDGQAHDDTAEVDGLRTVYDEQRKPTGQVPDKGENVSLFSEKSVEDFLRDSLRAYPGARNVVLVLNAHGAPAPHFGGEAIIKGELQKSRFEEMTVRSFGHALGNVAAQTGARLSLLDINTCEMGKVENVLELGEHADLVIASPQNEFVPKGHEYTAAFQDIVGACETLLADSSLTPRQLGEHIIDITTRKTTFVENGVTENPIPTLDLYDSSLLPQVAQGLDQAGRQLSKLLKSERRDEVIGSLKKAFNFREHVVDLRGFLNGIDDPAARDLGQAIDAMTLVNYGGSFRGRDYSQAGPVAVYMPAFPGDALPPVLLPELGEDIKVAARGLLGPAPEKIRPWVVGQSARLHTLHSNISVNYPAMLEVLPNVPIAKALTTLPQVDELLALDQELQTHISFSSKEKVEPLRQRIADLVTPLTEALAEVDVEGWLRKFEAIGGAEKMAHKARRQALDRARAAALVPVKQYQQMDNLPPGWKLFLEDLTNAVVDTEWAAALDLKAPAVRSV